MKIRRLAVACGLALTACAAPGTVHPRTTPSAASSPGAPAGSRYHTLGPAREIGTGYLVGTSLDGSAAYVSDVDATSKPGCEGRPRSMLFRLPVTGATRELLADSSAGVSRGPGGHVALAEYCEEFFTSLQVGTESPDGHLSDLKAVELRVNGQPTPSRFSWSSDGTHLLGWATGPEGPPTPATGKIWSIDPATGAASELFDIGSGPVVAVAQLAGGTYVVSVGLASVDPATGSSYRIALRDTTGVEQAHLDGDGFAIAPDGRQVAVFGIGVSLIAPGQTAPTGLVGPDPTGRVTSAGFSPDGRAIAYIVTEGQDHRVSIVTIPNRTVTPVPAPGFVASALFTGDGAALVLSTLSGELRDKTTVLLVPFGP